jgi:hypothetical protein
MIPVQNSAALTNRSSCEFTFGWNLPKADSPNMSPPDKQAATTLTITRVFARLNVIGKVPPDLDFLPSVNTEAVHHRTWPNSLLNQAYHLTTPNIVVIDTDGKSIQPYIHHPPSNSSQNMT